MKWDGLRALAHIAGDRVRLTSRTTRDITTSIPSWLAWPRLGDAEQAVLDGEIVALGADGWPDFEALQQRMNIGAAAQARHARGRGAGYLPGLRPALAERPALLDLPYSRRRELLEGLGLTGATGRCPRRSPASPAPTSRRSRCSTSWKASWPSGCSRGTSPAAGPRPGGRSRTSAARRSSSAAGSPARAAGPAGSAPCWSGSTTAAS